MHRARVWVVVFFATLALGTAQSCSCGEDQTCAPLAITSDTSCVSTDDCNNAGFDTLTCIDGLCRRACTRDSECALTAVSEGPDECKMLKPPLAICENQVCAPACSSNADCSDGQTCERTLPFGSRKKLSDIPGRCALYYQSFEIPEGQTAIDFVTIGWQSPAFGMGDRIENPKLAIAFRGPPNCTEGDRFCAGDAASGVRYALLERQPTPPKGTPDTGPTCRPCACCLECLGAPTIDGTCAAGCPAGSLCNTATSLCEHVPVIPACPLSPTVATPIACPASVSPACSAVCTACEQCQAAPAARLGERLVSCERDAGLRTCPFCANCDNTVNACRSSMCPVCNGNPTGAECSNCTRANCNAALSSPECTACKTCGDSKSCDPNTAECANLAIACQGQGADGCFPTPLNYPRAQLRDDEQAMYSAPIEKLAGASGDVVLELDYVPFNVGDRYRPGVQGQDPASWTEEDQLVVIQFCSANCGSESGWSNAKYGDGREVTFPPSTQRYNGLSLGVQSALDWRSGRLRVPIPEGMRTRDFRFRLVPKLAEDVRVGIDDVYVRRLP